MKNALDMRIILKRMRRVLTKFLKLIWTNTYHESLLLFNRGYLIDLK